MTEFLQAFALAAEVLGLLLIAIELYKPDWAKRIDQLVARGGGAETRGRLTIIVFCAVWVIGAAIAGLIDPALTIPVNIGFAVAVVVLLCLVWVVRKIARLSGVVGRGDSLAGLGLLLAVTGVAIEVSQL